MVVLSQQCCACQLTQQWPTVCVQQAGCRATGWMAIVVVLAVTGSVSRAVSTHSSVMHIRVYMTRQQIIWPSCQLGC